MGGDGAAVAALIMALVGVVVAIGAFCWLMIQQHVRKAPMTDIASQASTPIASCPGAVQRKTLIFLDPGHGADVAPTPASSGGSQGIDSGENGSSGNEAADVYAVALRAKQGLERAGYSVALSRDGDPDPARQTLWQKGLRAQKANLGGPADIGVSIHTDSVATIGAGEVYYDAVGTYRTNDSDGHTQRFTNEVTAARSEIYARAFVAVRQRLQHATINATPGHDFPSSRGLGSFGTIPVIMLTAQDVPWVYNEMARTSDEGLSGADRDKYATAIVEGVEQSLPPLVCG